MSSDPKEQQIARVDEFLNEPVPVYLFVLLGISVVQLLASAALLVTIRRGKKLSRSSSTEAVVPSHTPMNHNVRRMCVALVLASLAGLFDVIKFITNRTVSFGLSQSFFMSSLFCCVFCARVGPRCHSSRPSCCFSFVLLDPERVGVFLIWQFNFLT
eukprot:GABV01009062.1.p1 GENE.GABV01009062.1~~GABV01009062.1.p1  ORF type:complete len:157 (-),score=26.11 GABV01009062.1:334-804(-)